jgi:hypothetical protein
MAQEFKPFVKPAYAYSALPMLTAADVPDTALMRTLYRALSVARPHGSLAESRFVAWLCNRLPVTMIDGAGNIHVDLRRGPQHRTMFTSHTDTVHRKGGSNNIRLDISDPTAVKWRAGEGACLGADDGAGVALMVHMIHHKVPGLYVFFRGEECGGQGSSWLAKNMASCLKEIDRCVSFDRAGYSDVITHQAMGRCCSDAFANALADAMTNEAMTTAYVPDDTGSFTDSANFTDDIAECTNLSVGYKHQHGDGEWTDVTYLPIMAEQLCVVQWDDLPVERKPGEQEYLYGGYSFGRLTQSRTRDKSKMSTVDLTLMDALEAAEDGFRYDLKQVVAEWVHPEDPTVVMGQLDMSRCSDEEYGQYADALAEGDMMYEEILEYIANDVTKN